MIRPYAQLHFRTHSVLLSRSDDRYYGFKYQTGLKRCDIEVFDDQDSITEWAIVTLPESLYQLGEITYPKK